MEWANTNRKAFGGWNGVNASMGNTHPMGLLLELVLCHQICHSVFEEVDLVVRQHVRDGAMTLLSFPLQPLQGRL